MQNDINKNKNIIKIADDNWSHFKVRSNSLLSKEFTFIMNYPGNLIPVVDNNELTGVINKNKIKNIPSSKLNQILVRQVKEDAPYIALETSCERTLKIEMQNKAIQDVFIIDRQFKFKGKYSVELVKSRQKFKKCV